MPPSGLSNRTAVVESESPVKFVGSAIFLIKIPQYFSNHYTVNPSFFYSINMIHAQFSVNSSDKYFVPLLSICGYNNKTYSFLHLFLNCV